MKTFLLLLLLLSHTLYAPLLYAKEGVQIGICDQYRRDFLPEGQVFILPLFEKRGEKWQPIDLKLPRQEWTIAFDGKSLGTISSSPTNKQPLNDIHNIQIPEGDVKHPDVPQNKSETGKPIYHPLVLVKGGHFDDPNRWKPQSLSDEELKKLHSAFRKKYPKVSNCAKNSDDAHPWKFNDSDIKVVKSYGSNKGSAIAEVQLNGYQCGELPDLPFQSQYFALPPGEEGRFMSLGLKLIDAGDYDGDGKSELIFSDRSEGGDDDNSDGYSIWGPAFTRLAQRVWFYH